MLFIDDRLGSLEAGKLADFIVLDRDLLSYPVKEIAGTQVLQTYVAGKRVNALRPPGIPVSELDRRK